MMIHRIEAHDGTPMVEWLPEHVSYRPAFRSGAGHGAVSIRSDRDSTGYTLFKGATVKAHRVFEDLKRQWGQPVVRLLDPEAS